MTIAIARSAADTQRGFFSLHTHWDRTAFAVAVLVLLPLLAITGLAFSAGEAGTLAHLARTVLTPALWETLALATGVLALALVTGVTTGWLIATYRFPGRDVLGWALILPFAIPTYISAYAYVEALDYFGPVQTAYRSLLGVKLRSEYAFPEVRSIGGTSS